ncbi:MAG: molybdopterin-dependent oxidoreductase [Terriglobales bacterium]
MRRPSPASAPQPDPRREMARRTRRSFLMGATAGLAGLGAWEWLNHRPMLDGLASPFRRLLGLNERLSEHLLFNSSHLARQFPITAAGWPRVNGMEGAPDATDSLADWRLLLAAPNSTPGAPSASDLSLSLADLQRLPRVSMTTELRCIEGWTQVVQWAGVRLADFAARYPLFGSGNNASAFPYIALETADGGYYVGFDRESALHPQTLLADEMNGAPLTPDHGAPLRLVSTVKYGIKSLKWVGRIYASRRRPPDFWAQQGYDWYAGL